MMRKRYDDPRAVVLGIVARNGWFEWNPFKDDQLNRIANRMRKERVLKVATKHNAGRVILVLAEPKVA